MTTADRTSPQLGVAVVIGNGFTLDCASQLGMRGIDLLCPVDWPLRIASQPGLGIREALPHFFEAFERRRRENPVASHFDLLREIADPNGDHSRRQEVEMRHFLSLAYRFLTREFFSQPLIGWRWAKWLHAHRRHLVTAVSFNYDCLLEVVLNRLGHGTCRQHRIADRAAVRVFKPHGSADFDLRGLVGGALRYPLQVYGSMNDFPLRIVPYEEWDRPPSEPLIVLPYEKNPYSRFQWVQPGYSAFAQLAPKLTHCVFVGLSYHPADRAEIDHFLASTPSTCRIVIANRTPPAEFLDAVRRSGREWVTWTDGPGSLDPV